MHLLIMDNNGSSCEKLAADTVVKLEPVEFVLCDGNEGRKEQATCFDLAYYEEDITKKEVKEETKLDNVEVILGDVLNGVEHSNSLDTLQQPSGDNTNDQDPFADKLSKESKEDSETVVKPSLTGDTPARSPQPQSAGSDNGNKDIVYLDPPVNVFLKEEFTNDYSSDEESEPLKVREYYTCLSRSSPSTPKRLGGATVLLLSPEKLQNYSVNKGPVEISNDSSSDSLGYNSGSDDSPSFCNDCNKVLVDKVSFNYHAAAYHSSGIECSHCNRRFRSKNKLKVHQENLLKCHEFIRSGKLFSERSRADENSKPPEVSLRLVPTHKLMKAYGDRDSEEVADDQLVYDSTKAVQTNPDPCVIEETCIEPEETTVCCKICRNVFTNKDDLKTHFLTHTERKDCKCDHCGKNFKSEKELYTHVENLVTGHTFLKSGQVSYTSFFGEPFYPQDVSSCQQTVTVDEADIKPIIFLDDDDGQ